MVGDRCGVPVDQGTGVGVEEFCVNIVVLIHALQDSAHR